MKLPVITLLASCFLANCSANLEQIASVQHIENLPDLVAESRQALVYLKTTREKDGFYRDADLLAHYYGGRRLRRSGSTLTTREGACSAFFIDLAQGHIATNQHCVDGVKSLVLKLANGKAYRGEVIGADKYTDVALLKVSDPDFDRQGLAELAFADSGKLLQGDDVFTLGAPLALRNSSTTGNIASFNHPSAREFANFSAAITDSFGEYIHHDAQLLSGNSGGPLLDAKGQVIGINSFGLADGRYDVTGMTSHAVSANTVQHVIAQLRESGGCKWGDIGVSWQRLETDLRQAWQIDDYPELSDYDTGVLIATVDEDSTAAKAGLQRGDVVFSLADRKITSHVDAFNVIAFTAPSTSLTVRFIRNGKVKKKTVKVALRHDPYDARPVTDTSFLWELGVAEINKGSRFYKLTKQEGLLITSDRAFPREHDREGCYLISVDDVKVTSHKQAEEYLADKKEVTIYSQCIRGFKKYAGYSTLREDKQFRKELELMGEE